MHSHFVVWPCFSLCRCLCARSRVLLSRQSKGGGGKGRGEKVRRTHGVPQPASERQPPCSPRTPLTVPLPDLQQGWAGVVRADTLCLGLGASQTVNTLRLPDLAELPVVRKLK
ncbi:hypothetical protein BT67DRAFT_439253 [Trichocladium antarcticum]|uniref:Secreted protein n=1 Tax=Trichocladium antarcticum TaxID=1450529 RepID=A0AAN6ZHU3_9PEZI|nr:hypothetical protein BT67DRAFT_439253 [Trichocladium antarcticum]